MTNAERHIDIVVKKMAELMLALELREHKRFNDIVEMINWLNEDAKINKEFIDNTDLVSRYAHRKMTMMERIKAGLGLEPLE